MMDSQRERCLQCFRTALRISSSVCTELMLYKQVFGKGKKKKVAKSTVIGGLSCQYSLHRREKGNTLSYFLQEANVFAEVIKPRAV